MAIDNNIIGSRKKYKTKIYIDGQFRGVKPYICTLANALMVRDNNSNYSMFATMDDEIFLPKDSPLVMMNSLDTNDELTLAFVRLNSYIFNGTIGTEIPQYALVDNYGRILTNNFGRILVP